MLWFIKRRDPALADVSDEALRQLTKLLYMDTADYFGHRATDWLAKQEQQIEELDVKLLRPRNLLARLTLGLCGHRLPLYPEEPRLCTAHKALDSRIIRCILQLVVDECTIQTNRYRSLRLKKMLKPSLEDWMKRVDSITALWLGEDKFRRVFGCHLKDRMPDCTRTKCEACMLAVIGGSSICLTDLRASVLARQTYNTELMGREYRRPRLLRVIDSWISFFQEDSQKEICECSKAMASEIVEMRTLARKKRDKRDERRRRRGKPPRGRSNVRVRLTKEGLPIPRQPRLRRRDKERLAKKTEKMETLLSLQETVVEQQEQEPGFFPRLVVDKDCDCTRITSSIYSSQKDNGTTEKMKDSKSNGVKQQHDFGKDTSLDKDTCEKEVVEEEFLVQGHRQLTPDDDTSCKSISIQGKLSFDTKTTSSWTSKIDEDSPHIVQLPRSEDILTREDTASSVYSCDERVKTTTKTTTMFEEALSVFSEFMRESAAIASLRLNNENKYCANRERETEREKSENHKAALAMLEGREQDEDAASCYETMGWGGPSR
ncbi:hypothetical protein N5P37_004051 [Trichoderma harzianum]|uniref:Uncharacterized protein n=1 Tax=Trichoderma harzianum CBS 226.95 TaxID=983964 RepID=A0A2T4ANX3_TRIHA|nr:hypothetical protein M431DRAFT_285786 [Trichoderma harzianum CBS 226.95]KAK0763067.1 hypothetical protein N5P37_004051 [Trichoderma harzianum]PTB58773.1 hypothetical protein M431DRAFT_285786 [Trichoderma harzianum CBS 226.95]